MKFSIRGIKFSISFPAVAIVCFVVFASQKGNRLFLMCFLASALHEAGHLLFINKYRGKPESIQVNPGEIRIITNSAEISYIQDVLITSAGVLFNFLFSIVSLSLHLLITTNLLFDFGVCNLCIGMFNLMPIKTFDGGQLLEFVLSQMLSAKTTEILMNIITVIVITPLATIVFYVLLISQFNYTLLLMVIFIISIIISKEMR